MAGWTDHLLVVFVAGLFPLYNARYLYPRMKRRLAENPHLRVNAYWGTIIFQWVVTAVVLAYWSLAERPLAGLGLSVRTGGWLWLGVAIASGIVLGLIRQRWQAVRDPAARMRLRSQLEAVAPILPHERREVFHFTLLALTAGVCEEIFFRGYLIWYLGHWLPLAAVVVLASALFGYAHLYQGKRGFVLTGALGLVFGVVYLSAGSLWLAMGLHAFIDVNNGLLAFRLLQPEAPAAGP